MHCTCIEFIRFLYHRDADDSSSNEMIAVANCYFNIFHFNKSWNDSYSRNSQWDLEIGTTNQPEAKRLSLLFH